jgi:hypothetical protein
MNEKWQAVAREAAVAGEQMAIGATALKKASYARPAYYGQVFFALSTGFERAAKLALVVDYAIDHGGTYPDQKTVREHLHDLRKLLDECDKIAERRSFEDRNQRLPRTAIHDGIIGVLSTFATNVTRYYNVDVITDDPKAAGKVEPIRAWFESVTEPVLDAHYTNRQREKAKRNADLIDTMIGAHSWVLFTNEKGDLITDVREASLQTSKTQFAAAYTRMYVMQIARFIGLLLTDLGHIAAKDRLDSVPSMSEMFAIFNNNDEYFRSRETWSIYP